MTKARPKTFSDMFACDFTAMSSTWSKTLNTQPMEFDRQITNLSLGRPVRNNEIIKILDIPNKLQD